METIGKLNYNGVIITLVKHENYFELTTKFDIKWRAKGYVNSVYRKPFENEEYIKSQFRMMVKEYVSIH